MLVAIISPDYSFIATCVGVVVVPSSAKPDPGVAAVTFIFVVSEDTNPHLRVDDGIYIFRQNVESFLVTVGLQRGPRANELLPRVTAQ